MVKRLVAVAALLTVSLWGAAAWAGQVYKLYVDGLACPFCAYGVEKKLLGVDGVERLDIDIDRGLVAVTVKDGATIDEATASQAVADAGFTLRDFEAPAQE